MTRYTNTSKERITIMITLVFSAIIEETTHASPRFKFAMFMRLKKNEIGITKSSKRTVIWRSMIKTLKEINVTKDRRRKSTNNMNSSKNNFTSSDRIHATICKPGLELFKNRIKEHCVYSMQNFIVKLNNGKVRTTPHKYKLNFYTKTVVAILPIETFAFNTFKFRLFHELVENGSTDGNLLFDYIGEIVGKEEVRGLITRTGDETKLITLQLEDLEKHKIKCTLFGELVDEVPPHLERDDGEPFIIVVQLFKSNMYLNSVNIQSTYYVFTCYFNPNLPEVIDYKKRLATDFVSCSQRISHLEAQSQYSVTDEINAGIVPVRTIEEVLNMTERLVKMIGPIYRVRHVLRRYRLQVIVTDGSGCLNLLVWNKEAEQMIEKAAEKVKELSKCKKGKSYPKYLENMIDKRFLFKLNIIYKTINAVKRVYSVTKLLDDESLMSSYGVPNSSSDASCLQMLANIPIAETNEDSNGHAAVFLSKDSVVESNCDSSCQTLAKRTATDAVDDSPAEAALSPDVQESANKTFKRNYGRKKID
ncbi:uncharacterized protein LOC110280175 [Arachis duranensis]|uniref:Uncharacterized protein LOC110280175 n=1 Tax=Arachis duranensis TaxID=130453 RepID=A0A9C6TM93_ARADU|nr:uncharacterized protein LOC110280175 [Arachis duranensis]